MALSWSFLALTLFAADSQPPSPPRAPRSLTSLDRPERSPIGKVACCAGPAHRTHQACSPVEVICANPCPDGIVDGLTIAASSAREEPKPGTVPMVMPKGAKPGGHDPEPSSAPDEPKKATLLKSTLPLTMPKVANPGGGDPMAKEVWPMALREAIRIGLDNSEVVRVIAFGGGAVGGCSEPASLKIDGDEKAKAAPIVIARLDADASLWRFKAEVMAHVRSVEQQYWNLAQAHVQLWAADRAATLAKEVYDREQAELVVGRGTAADVAEAAQRLEQFNLDLVTRTSDVITTERRLRFLLGLPPADNRRIIPITPTTEARIEPDWDASLTEMLQSQPDVVQQRLLVRLAELQLLLARNQLLPRLSLNALHQLGSVGWHFDTPEAVFIGQALNMLGPIIDAADRTSGVAAEPSMESNFLTWQVGVTYQYPLGRSPFPNARSAQYALLRSRAYYQQVVHQTTHSLARFFLEIDANYKQFKTASRLRAAAAQRLDAQRAYYEEGRITIDRFLDAVSQYATAVATEARYKTTYNISIAALEEAKGTLLAYDNIVIAEGPRKQRAIATAAAPSDHGPSKRDSEVVTTSTTAEKPTAPEARPANEQAEGPAPAPPAPVKTKTWSFSISIGGVNPVRIKGTMTADADSPAPGR